MLEQFQQIRILLANIQNNMSAMIQEREQLIKEFERLQTENEKLKQNVERKKNS